MATRASTDDRKVRPSRMSGEIQRPSTAPHSGTPSGNRHTLPSQLETTPEDKALSSTAAAPTPGHQRFVLADPVALRYLEEDPATTVLDRRRELPGYECYIVEQWTTSRGHPTFVITTYTGNPSNVVMVGVLSVPIDEASWSPRLRVYFKALNQYHARRRDTPLGILMVTNLSGFPSSLTVISVPDGDLRKHRFDFFVNENLKRLGCSGRVGLTLQSSSSATVAKFHQLYRTSDKNELYRSVIELVKLCQSALMLFDKLEIDYADGLLCDVTERAITDWWVKIGSEQYNIEPHDGILGPTTVAGLLGLLMGARNRLHAVNAPVSKDPFDVDAMKRGIGYFQKQQRMNRTRRLDRRTLDRLQKATQKAAEHDRWTMPKVLKNTAAELSGKGGEMLVDAVGRRDRAGIAEIETCDIERFVDLVYGERCKWLWRGKALKKHHNREQQEAERQRMSSVAHMNKGLVFRPDEQGGFTWTARKNTQDGMPVDEREQFDEVGTPGESSGEDDSKFGVLNAAKSGLGKFKGAVGLKGHQQKVSVDEARQSPTTPVDEMVAGKRRPLFRRAHSSPTSPRSPNMDGRLDTVTEQGTHVDAYHPEHAKHAESVKGMPGSSLALPGGLAPSRESLDVPPSYVSKEPQHDSGDSGKHAESEQTSEQPSQTVTADPSIAGSIYNGVDMNDVLPTGPETEKDVGSLLRRTLSLSHFISIQLQHRSDDAYPRHLSFSLAEESVLTWPSVVDDADADADEEARYHDPKAQLASQDLLAKQAIHLRLALNSLSTTTAPWTASQLHTLDSLLQQADHDAETLHKTHEPHLEHVTALQVHSEGVLRQERERMEEGRKEIETLGPKLEYEIGELRGRVEDAGQGVLDFGKGVGRVEERVAELERKAERGEVGWLGGMGRCVVC